MKFNFFFESEARWQPEDLHQLNSVARKCNSFFQELPQFANYWPELKKSQLPINLIGSRAMKSLNQQHRERDYPTDVLTFPFYTFKLYIEEQNFKVKEFLPDASNTLAEIYICQEIAMKQAKQFGNTPKEEVIRLLVHALWHAMGMDHERSKKESKTMNYFEAKLLAKIGFANLMPLTN